MAIIDTYKWGQLWIDAQMTIQDLEDNHLLEVGARQEILDRVRESPVDFEFDEDWGQAAPSLYSVDGGAVPMIRIGTFGGYPGEAIDRANADAARDFADGKSYVHTYQMTFGGCTAVILYLNWEDCTLEEAEEVIELAEGFRDYPVLDEDLWSQYEQEEWDETISELISNSEEAIAEVRPDTFREFSEEQICQIREQAGEFYGYWESGWFDPETWDKIVDDVLSGNVQLHQDEKLF